METSDNELIISLIMYMTTALYRLAKQQARIEMKLMTYVIDHNLFHRLSSYRTKSVSIKFVIKSHVKWWVLNHSILFKILILDLTLNITLNLSRCKINKDFLHHVIQLRVFSLSIL